MTELPLVLTSSSRRHTCKCSIGSRQVRHLPSVPVRNLAAFVRTLHSSHTEEGHSRENTDLASEVLAAWMDDADGWYNNAGRNFARQRRLELLRTSLAGCNHHE
ncbi:DUF7660 family protein [Streptomyces sp. XY006]|uniref:DUF7660 family protein n=1 Tax=Streptomyces sp. XY006 TaxID=2021410 RepID=UPI003F92867F